MDGRRRRSRCHLGELGLSDGRAETVSGLELFAACVVVVSFCVWTGRL